MTDPGHTTGVDPDVLQRGRVGFRWHEGVATVELARPDIRNAQTPDTWAALARIGETLPGETRVVLVRGQGPSFSAGLDRTAFRPDGALAGVAAAPDPVADTFIADAQAGFSWLSDPAFVSIAAVQGHAVGAGFQLALACDLIVAAEDASFRMAEVGYGLVPDLGGTARLTRAIGPARALEICATGRPVDAAEAARIGLTLATVPVAGLDAAVDQLVAALLAQDTEAVRAITRLFHGAEHRTAEDQQAAERAEQLTRLRAVARKATSAAN